MNSTDMPLRSAGTTQAPEASSFSPSALKYCGKSALMRLVYGPQVEFEVPIIDKNIIVVKE